MPSLMFRLILVLLLACVAAAQNVTITNASPAPTKGWVPVAVPYLDAQGLPEAGLFKTTDGRPWPAQRANTVGYSTVFYDVLADLPGNGVAKGSIVPGGTPTPTKLSDWVADDFSRLIPRFDLQVLGGTKYVSAPANPVLEFLTPVRQSWSFTTRCGPLVLHFFATLYGGQDVVDWQLFLVHSDPSTPAVQCTATYLTMTLGEPWLVENGAPLGLPTPQYDAVANVWTLQMANPRLDMADGQGLLLHGTMLCTDSTRPWWHHLMSSDPATQQRVQRLLGRANGPVVATSNWKGRWMPFQATVPPGARDTQELAERWAWVSQPFGSPGDPWQARRRGLTKLPGSSGSQDDFAASRGAELTLGDGRHALVWQFHTEEPMRPMHYREMDGSPVLKSRHPNWWTWAQPTHYSCSASSDRLGKPCPVPPQNANGWGGKDDQHMGNNCLSASIAMFDWPAHRMLMGDEINVEQANVRWLPGQSVDAARAVGRRLQSNSKRWFLTGREDVWQMVVDFEKRVVQQSWRPLPNFTLLDTPTTDVRVLVDTNNQPVPAIVLWQEGLGLLGHAEAWAAHRYRQKLGLPTVEGTELIGQHMVAVASTMVRHYFAQVDGRWRFSMVTRWTGELPPVEWIARTTPLPGFARDHMPLSDAWFSWTGGGLYYLARAEHGLPLPEDVRQRLDSIATEWETRVAPTAGIAAREWFAVVQR